MLPCWLVKDVLPVSLKPARATDAKGERYDHPGGAMKQTGSAEHCHAVLVWQGNMAEDTMTTVGIGNHGAKRLPSVDVDTFNIELKDDNGFLGDRASKGAFQRILDDLQKAIEEKRRRSARQKGCQRDQ